MITGHGTNLHVITRKNIHESDLTKNAISKILFVLLQQQQNGYTLDEKKSYTLNKESNNCKISLVVLKTQLPTLHHLESTVGK
jgi:hypothetical protein